MHIVMALTAEERRSTWTSFLHLAKTTPNECTESKSQKCADAWALGNLDDESHLFRRVGRRAFLAIVAPENDPGKVLSRAMLKLADNFIAIHGMPQAQVTMRSSLWAFYNYSMIPNNSQVSALYASFSGRNLQVVDLGMLWGGLFRHGKLISLVAPTNFRYINRLSPQEFFVESAADGNLNLTPYTQRWATQAGDIFVVTSADLPRGFIEIVEIAVEAMLGAQAPVSKIVSNLKAYYGEDEGKVFAAVGVT